MSRALKVTEILSIAQTGHPLVLLQNRQRYASRLARSDDPRGRADHTTATRGVTTHSNAVHLRRVHNPRRIRTPATRQNQRRAPSHASHSCNVDRHRVARTLPVQRLSFVLRAHPSRRRTYAPSGGPRVREFGAGTRSIPAERQHEIDLRRASGRVISSANACVRDRCSCDGGSSPVQAAAWPSGGVQRASTRAPPRSCAAIAESHTRSSLRQVMDPPSRLGSCNPFGT